MKNSFSLLVLFLFTLVSHAQPANYEAATWRTSLLDNNIPVSAPPSLMQTKAELQVLKQRFAKLDAKKIAEIKYWDAGAPSYRWNQIAPGLVYQKQLSLLRTPTAWMNIAIYDATILAWKEKIKYKRKRPQETDPSLHSIVRGPITYSYPCEHSVTAAAAATVLAYFFPDKKDSIMQMAHAEAESRIDAGLQYPSDMEAGWKLGEQVALQIIEKAKQDGSALKWAGTVNTDPTKWTGKYPMGIALTAFTPLVMSSPAQFRPLPPPDFAGDMKELKDFKRDFTSTSSAYYWANHGGYDYWSDLAAKKMFENRVMDDAPAASRIYTVLHTAYHEATIAMFDAKYTYWGIRPSQYDSTYKPLISTPPFPGYPSGHATGASTTATVLSYFFPADAEEFEKLAKDCADSRFYAGIHFRTDNEVGTRMGKEIGKFVTETWMKGSK